MVTLPHASSSPRWHLAPGVGVVGAWGSGSEVFHNLVCTGLRGSGVPSPALGSGWMFSPQRQPPRGLISYRAHNLEPQGQRARGRACPQPCGPASTTGRVQSGWHTAASPRPPAQILLGAPCGQARCPWPKAARAVGRWGAGSDTVIRHALGVFFQFRAGGPVVGGLDADVASPSLGTQLPTGASTQSPG